MKTTRKQVALAAALPGVVAASTGWTVVDMKQDWKVIYPFDQP